MKKLIIVIIIFLPSFSLTNNKVIRLKVGITDNKPLMYLNEKGEAEGFFVDLLKHIAKKEKWELDFIQGSLEENLEWLENEKIDIMADLGKSYERIKKYEFTKESGLTSWGALYSLKDKKIEKLEDIQEKTIGVKEKDFFFSDPIYGLKKIMDISGLKVKYKYYQQYIQIIQALQNKEIDYALLNHLFGEAYKLEYEIEKTFMILAPIELCYAFPKYAEKTKILRDTIDKYLIELKSNEDSIYYKLLKKYIYKIPNNFNYKIIITLLFTLILSSTVFIVIVKYLKTIIKKKTKELEIKNKALEKLVEEKNVLIKEIHHRIKNNLQNIISLIYLQKSDIKDNHIKTHFIDLLSRVKAIATVHENLYSFDLLSEIKIEDFITKHIESLNKIYNIENKALKTEINVEDIKLPLDQSVPLSLLLNEAITNCYKHSFNEVKNPVLYISMKKNFEKIEVKVKDNGKGFGCNIEEKESLGINIMRELTKQLKGEIKFYNDNGAVVEIKFSII